MACLLLLLVLAVFLPYGPGLPGIDWELGIKANPLAPAYPGIKPEWYFLWLYQLLKEFPPHLFGLEGPQLCLFIVSIMLGAWGLIPWLDRRARRDEPSPAFSDFGFTAILFVAFLMLMAWDVGVAGPVAQPADAAIVARVAAMWTLGIAAAGVLIRVFVFQHRWFVFTAAAVLHIVLHGFVGMSYLAAWAIAAAAAVAVVSISVLRGRGTPERSASQ
jgi:quinol-cytochrome oxidoreductase complex cytochrome b subunit